MPAPVVVQASTGSRHHVTHVTQDAQKTREFARVVTVVAPSRAWNSAITRMQQREMAHGAARDAARGVLGLGCGSQCPVARGRVCAREAEGQSRDRLVFASAGALLWLIYSVICRFSHGSSTQSSVKPPQPEVCPGFHRVAHQGIALGTRKRPSFRVSSHPDRRGQWRGPGPPALPARGRT